MGGRSEAEPATGARTTGLVLQLLAEGTPVRLEVTGASMAPFIRSGDTLTLGPPGDRSPRVGDVVAYTNGERLIIHRVVGTPAGRLLTRGDAAAQPDGVIAAASVVGVVVRVEDRDARARMGTGPERRLIGLASRLDLMVPLLRVYERLKRLRRGR